MGATLGLSVGRRVAPQPEQRFPMETIIIFRIGSLGDTVVALPCFHQIVRKFPNSRRILITDTPASPKAASVESIVGTGGLIGGVIYFPPPPRNARDFMRLRTQILETKARTLIYIADRNIYSTLRDLWFFRLCGILNVIGAPIRHDLRRPRIDPVTGETEQEAVRLTRCLAPLTTAWRRLAADDLSRSMPAGRSKARIGVTIAGRPYYD